MGGSGTDTANGGHGIGGETTEINISNTNISYVKGGYVQQNCAEGDLWDKNSPEGAPAIGSMTDGAVINLDGVTIVKAEGGGKSAGIGARYWTGVTVNISNSTIKKVVGGTGSAGIGGSHPSHYNASSKTINVTIMNSTINAIGGQYGAGIGSGYDTYCHSASEAPMTTVTIDAASKITAQGGKMAAGIGTGHNAINFTGNVQCDTSNVKADTSEDECCLGAECTAAENVGKGALKKVAFGLT